MSENPNRVKSIKQKFESQILNNANNEINIIKPSVKNIKPVKRSLTTSFIPSEPPVCKDFLKQTLARKNSEPTIINEETENLSDDDLFYDSLNERQESCNERVKFKRHVRDRKSQIKRSPAFRCGEKSPKTQKNVSSSSTNQSFLFQFKDAQKDDSLNLTDTLKLALNQPLPNGPPPKKPPRTFQHDSPRGSPVSENPDGENNSQIAEQSVRNKSFMFERLNTSQQPVAQASVKNKHTVNTSCTNKPDINHMLSKLEEALIQDKNKTASCKNTHNLPDLITHSTFKSNQKLISRNLQLHDTNRDNQNHYMVTDLNDINSDTNNCNAFFKSLNCASNSSATDYAKLENIIRHNLNSSCQHCGSDRSEPKGRILDGCSDCGRRDVEVSVNKTNLNSNRFDFLTGSSSKFFVDENFTKEHIYAEPFEFMNDLKSVLPPVARNTETEICSKVCENDHSNVREMLGKFEETNHRKISQENPFEITRRKSNENNTLQATLNLGDIGEDKRNSNYVGGPLENKSLHYMSTKIYDIPTDTVIPEALNFNIIKKECVENNTLLKKQCNSENREEIKYSTVKLSRPKFLNIENTSGNNYRFDRKQTLPLGSLEMAENDHKMADSGLSSMETTPDIEDIDTDTRTVTLTRTLTEKRKHYVCRMSSTIDYENVTKKLTDKTNLNSCYSTLKKRSAKHKVPNAKDESIEKLFDMCLLVGYNSLTSHGYVKTVFPAEITPPEHIENLIFPEFQSSSASVKPKNSSAKKINQTSLKPNEDTPETNKASPNLSKSRNFKKHLKSNIHDEQNYSLILTDENGIRKFGYCRKIKPENSEICLPLVYCIVTKTRAPGFYFKVLKELETRHGQSDYQSRNIFNQLYNAKIPKTGQHLHVKIPNSPRPKSAAIPSHYLNVSELKRLSLAYETAMPTSKSHNDLKSKDLNNDLIEIGKVENQIEQFEMLGGDDRFEIINRRLLNQNCNNRSFTEIVISRPYDCRLENNEMTILFDCLNVETLLNVFGSLLIERKVILVGTSMSKICSCIEGLQSILYPFVWQHTLVSILPSNLVEITSAPIPIIAGILENGDEDITVDEGVLVNIDSSTILASEGDEPTLIPSSLSSSLKLSLSLVKTTTVNTDPTRNVLISEAFIKFFIAAIGTYVTGFEHGEFQKEALINSHPCKTTRFFLEWFTETAMFKHFIHEKQKMIQISNQSDENASQNELKAENTSENAAIKTKNIDLTSSEQTQENSNIRKITHSNDCSLENGNNSKTKDEMNHLSEYYKIFDSKIFEFRPNDNSGKKTTELFLKNHRVLNRKGKTISEKFKEFMNS